MKKKRTGVITVEAIMVMPIVIGVILLLYSIIVIQYNNVLFRTAAIQISNRIGANWSQIDGRDYTILDEDMKPVVFSENQTPENLGRTGRNVITSAAYAENDPYATILQIVNIGEEEKMDAYATYAEKMLLQADSKHFNLLEMKVVPKNETDINALELILGGDFTMVVQNTYQNALLDIIGALGFDIAKTQTATIKSNFNDPVEFIRNVDFVKEMIQNSKKKKAKGN